MSVINDSFNQAVDYLVQQRLNEVKFDKTVVGTLVSVPTDKDKDYKVKYENATVVAEPVDETVEYKKDDQVYLQLCADDRKLILGKQSNNEDLTTKYSEPWDRLLDMTDNIYDSKENKIIIPNTNYTLY